MYDNSTASIAMNIVQLIYVGITLLSEYYAPAKI